MKSFTSPGIAESRRKNDNGSGNINISKPVKSCLRRSQRTISGGDPQDLPHYRSASSVPSTCSLEDTIASLLQPETRRFVQRHHKAGTGQRSSVARTRRSKTSPVDTVPAMSRDDGLGAVLAAIINTEDAQRNAAVSIQGGVPATVWYRSAREPATAETVLATPPDTPQSPPSTPDTPPSDSVPRDAHRGVFFQSPPTSRPMQRLERSASSTSWKERRGVNSGVAANLTAATVAPVTASAARSRLYAVSASDSASFPLGEDVASDSGGNNDSRRHVFLTTTRSGLPTLSTSALSPPLSAPSVLCSDVESTPSASVQFVQCHLQGVSPSHDPDPRPVEQSRFSFEN